ncbi:MAG: GH92 family glycosyl hydrolase, partial [Alistipes sp.]|nr:GH92 family glycosyl hydrolase [Alistipes sp.]
FAHVNLSGVGCPELGSLLLMPTTGELEFDYKEYGSKYTDEAASPGYYTNTLTKYGIKTEVTATERCAVARFTFPRGQSNILMNLGEGLTNESGAFLNRVSDSEIEGMKLLGTFCYNSQAVFPIYFVMRVEKAPEVAGYFKKQRPMYGVEAEWDPDHGRYKNYYKYHKEIAGDDIGAYFTYNTADGERIEVKIGVSFVSMENARLNLEVELDGKDFDAVWAQTREKWNRELSKINIEGGTDDQRTVFYTALYHTMIHPNILSDVNMQYPATENPEIRTGTEERYTVFSLWDTYRNFHQLMTLVYPDDQRKMLNSMMDTYLSSGWMPKWELYGRETLTMEGDPAIPVFVDSYFKGLRDWDSETAWEAFYKSAMTPGPQNFLRPDNDDYLTLGYVPIRSEFDNSVSHALEYNVADWALSRFAEALGKREEANYFYDRSLGYRHYYDPRFGTFRPKNPDGTFYSPFDPVLGADFEENPGFHEGNAWNYTFAVPHDVYGLAKLMGGSKKFVDKLQGVFDNGYYDPANEPDITYPYLFSYFKGHEWRTPMHVRNLLEEYFTTRPDGIPGNDDTGTMSAWAIFSMMGFYPDVPADPSYTLTSPVFDRITIELDPRYYDQKQLVIETRRSSPEDVYIGSVEVGGRKHKGYRISHNELVNAGKIVFDLKSKP